MSKKRGQYCLVLSSARQGSLLVTHFLCLWYNAVCDWTHELPHFKQVLYQWALKVVSILLMLGITHLSLTVTFEYFNIRFSKPYNAGQSLCLPHSCSHQSALIRSLQVTHNFPILIRGEHHLPNRMRTAQDLNQPPSLRKLSSLTYTVQIRPPLL